MVALLDVNVLIALLDADHMHHSVATDWLSEHLDAGWASCPLTQNGCIRILSQAAYPNRAPAAEVAARLAHGNQREALDCRVASLLAVPVFRRSRHCERSEASQEGRAALRKWGC